MELVRFRLPNSKPFAIAPLGDVQWNGDRTEVWADGLKRHIDRALEANAWFIGLGDLTDFASPSSRAKLRFLKPTRGRWVGLHEGHHTWQFKDGSTTETRLAELLGCPHLGTEAIIEWVWGNSTFQTWSHHGWGAGEEAALLTRLKRVSADWDQVAAFFLGHCTKLASTFIPRLVARFDGTRSELVERRIALVGSGGWSKAKIVGSRDGRIPRGNYVELAGMRPVSLGAPLVYVTRAPKGAVSSVELEIRNR